MFLPNITGGLMLQTMLYMANQSVKYEDNPYNYMAGNSHEVSGIRCFGVYGCFPLEHPWTTSTRQVSTHPEKPSKINAKFPVFNKYNKNDLPRYIDLNDPDNVRNVGINPEGKIYVIAHGYIESGDRPWIRDLMFALLDEDKTGTASVIIVDWGGGSNPPYAQAVANIRLVGAITAHVLFLVYEELKLPNMHNVHFIGHSLGAHLGGYAGYTLQRDFGLQLGRITGLDPAEPLFSDTEPIVRLDKTDARYVDIVHSDGSPFIKGGLGMAQPIGHVDFYPNGGYDNPGCDVAFQDYLNGQQSRMKGMTQFIGCNHIRSQQFFTESVRPGCPFKAIACESYENFLAGNCFKCGENRRQCIQFGFHSYRDYKFFVQNGGIVESTPILAYLMTASKSPYCQVHYKIHIKISASEDSIVHGGEIGKMYFTLHAENHLQTERISFTKDGKLFEPDHEYFSVLSGDDVGIPKYITVEWEYKTNLLNPLTWRILSSPRVYIEQVTIDSLEHGFSLKMCSMFASPVVAGTSTTLRAEYCPE